MKGASKNIKNLMKVVRAGKAAKLGKAEQEAKREAKEAKRDAEGAKRETKQAKRETKKLSRK